MTHFREQFGNIAMKYAFYNSVGRIMRCTETVVTHLSPPPSLSLVLTHRKILFRPDDISTTSEMRRSWNALSNWKTARPSTSGKKCMWLSRSFKRNLLQYEIQSRSLVKKSSALKLRFTILLCCVVKYATNI